MSESGETTRGSGVGNRTNGTSERPGGGASTPAGPAGEPSGDASLGDLDLDELTALVEELRSENHRLREEYARARRGEYRRSASALVALGLLSVVGGLVFPIAREVLFILGAVGLFGGALTWYLTPDRLITATVGRSVYDSVADIGGGLRDELGLQETNVYVPVPRGDATGASVRLFVPQSSGYDLPDPEELTPLFVAPDSDAERGVAVRPTASRLVHEFEESTTDPVASDPDALAAQLVDALVEQFELVDGADPEVDEGEDRMTVRVRGGAYDDATGFDHPVASFLGSGAAVGLDRPVTVESERSSGRTVVTCQW